MPHTFVMIQTAPEEGSPPDAKRLSGLIEKANTLWHPDLIVMPETCMWEYSSEKQPVQTSAAGTLQYSVSLNGPFVTIMQETARRFGTWLVFGILENAAIALESRCYNTLVMINDKGNIVRIYRKTHLYDALGSKESDYFLAGNRLFEPIDTPFGKIGAFVCYELRFPEIARYQRSHGADIILIPSAWVRGERKEEQFRTLAAARAIENSVYILACNKASQTTTGKSLAIDPSGAVTASAAENGQEYEQIIPVTIDTECIRTARSQIPAFESRHTELYIDL